jgi:hypothetical protein
MKNTILLLFMCVALVSGCSKKELNKEDALVLLQKKGNYPNTYTYEIYFKDSEDGRKMLDAGLEKDGLVRVQRNRKTGDNTGAVIEFTDLAKPYLLSPDKGQLSSVQKVKLADEVLNEIIDLTFNEQKDRAQAIYTTKFVGQTPFIKLEKKDFTKTKDRKAIFILTKEGWKLQ